MLLYSCGSISSLSKKALTLAVIGALRHPFQRKVNMKTRTQGYYGARIAVVAVGGEGVRIGRKHNPKLLLKLNGRPFLRFVLDLLLDQFEIIYLLTGFYSRPIRRFVRESFPSLTGYRIHLIDGGREGNARAIARLKDKIDEPFLYMDGNVICSLHILRKLASAPPSAITLLVSPVSLVQTHLHVRVVDDNIVEMLPIVENGWQKAGLLCSLGIMKLDNQLFELHPKMSDFGDLDLFIQSIFQSRPDLKVKPLLYKGWWCCIHTVRDVRFAERYGRKLFSSLIRRAESVHQKGGNPADIQKSR